MRPFLLLFLPGILLCTVLVGCYYPQHGKESDSWTEVSEREADSASFCVQHHYWAGYNFRTDDTLTLQTAPPLEGLPDYGALPNDTVRIGKGEIIVVAGIMRTPSDSTDSVWVKVARDQVTQGWIPEQSLLDRSVPDDPLSRFIHRFSGNRSLVGITLLGLAFLFWLVQTVRRKQVRIVHFRDLPSFYPTLLCLCVSGTATLYGSMQRFVPQTWTEFYFHPTLNPFDGNIPLILSLFLFSVWMVIIVAIAVVDELRRQPDLGDTLSYLTSLGGVCMILYLVFTLTTPIYIGYPLLVAYWYFAIRKYWRNRPSHLLCGVCGHPIPHTGRCPNCGTLNENKPI